MHRRHTSRPLQCSGLAPSMGEGHFSWAETASVSHFGLRHSIADRVTSERRVRPRNQDQGSTNRR